MAKSPSPSKSPPPDEPSPGTSLSLYDRIQNPIDAISVLGEVMFKSQMCNVASREQGMLFAWECLTRRCPPFMLKEQYHVIFNQLSMKSSYMQSSFQRAGGRVRQLEHSSNRAAAELTYDGCTTTHEFTWEQCKAEPVPYEQTKTFKESDVVAWLANPDPNKKQIALKPKYATPRSRGQMLWARMISDAINSVCPQVCQGLYTAEESGGDSGPADVGDDAVDVESTTVETVAPTATKSEPNKPVDVTPESPVAATTPASTTATTPEFCTTEQANEITALFATIGTTPEQIEKALAKREVKAVRSLKFAQAEILIQNLRKAAWEQDAAKAKRAVNESLPLNAGASKPAEFSRSKSDQASPDEIKLLKALIVDLDGAAPGSAQRFIEIMRNKGLKYVDLSAYDVEVLTHRLKAKVVESFFEHAMTVQNLAPSGN